MCRMYGFIATDSTRLDCSLVNAQNALQVQSDIDSRGVRNPDGWGIAHWGTSGIEVVQSTDPAFADKRFANAAYSITSDAVIAHVRAATVGRVAPENTHPFRYGAWAFAHNGTISGFEHVRTHMDIGPFGPPQGATDSELAFRWLLNRMADYDLDPGRPAQSIEPILDLVGDAVLELVRVSLSIGTVGPPKLNFILSDGDHMVASRWGNTLYWTFRRGVRDCAVCGTSHCPSADAGYRAVAIASEPVTAEDWVEIPEATLLGVGPDARTTPRDLLAPAPTPQH